MRSHKSHAGILSAYSIRTYSIDIHTRAYYVTHKTQAIKTKLRCHREINPYYYYIFLLQKAWSRYLVLNKI